MKKVAILFCILLLLSGCANSQNSVEDNENLSLLGQLNQVEGLVQVETEYGTLSYSKKYEPYMVVEQKKDGNQLIVQFSCEVDQSYVDLFELVISEEVEANAGTIIGTDSVVRQVGVQMKDLSSMSMSKETLNLLYALQEDINVILSELKGE